MPGINPLSPSKTSNKKTSEDEKGAIHKANSLIQERLKESLGEYLAQDTHIQFSEITFNRIVENLKLLFFPDIQGTQNATQFRDLEENSLGYNNLLYLATVLAELTAPPITEDPEYLKKLIPQYLIDQVTDGEVDTENKRRDHNHRGRVDDFSFRRPGDLLGFDRDLGKKALQTLPPLHNTDSS